VTGVQAAAGAFPATEAGVSSDLGLDVAGQRIVLVSMSIAAGSLLQGAYTLRDVVGVEFLDKATDLILASLAVSPAAPFATLTPPFGALRATAGGDVQLQCVTRQGSGACFLDVTLFYYYQKA
jgi:hypothetical protein